jgi:AraC-like DNA-binding protein
MYVALEPEVPLRDIAARVGISERAVQRIVADLEGECRSLDRRCARRRQKAVWLHRGLQKTLVCRGSFTSTNWDTSGLEI